MLVLVPQSSLADTIIFHDLSAPVTVSVTDPSRELALFDIGVVEVQVCGPNNATLMGYDQHGALYFPIIEPNEPSPFGSNVLLSDLLLVDFEPTLALVDFFSYEGRNISWNCRDFPEFPCIAETGGIQTATELLWSDGTVDTIQFQSDISSDIPEPSTVMLLATVAGLTMFVGRRRRRTQGAAPYSALATQDQVRRMR